ncbi:MAG: FliM/FliN family flagellar motor switch protein [Terricaulis sp.]
MIAARPWLPDGALSDGVLERGLVTLAHDWAGRWLRAPKALDVRLTELKSDTKISSAALVLAAAQESDVAGVCFAIERIWLARLALAMLKLEGARQHTPADMQFLENLGGDAAHDFARTAFSFFGADPGRAPNDNVQPVIAPAGHHHVLLSMGAGATILNLYVGQGALIGARKRLAAPPIARAPLRSRADALAQQSFILGARLGASRIPLSTATALSVGDVIVLDQPRSAPVAVTIDGAPRPRPHWRWSEEKLRFKLEPGPELA